MDGFRKPLQFLSHQTALRDIAPGVWIRVKQASALNQFAPSHMMHGMCDRIHDAWTSLRGKSQSINLQEYLERVERRAA